MSEVHKNNNKKKNSSDLAGNILRIYVISGFRHKAAGNCALMCYYAASNGNFLPAFRDNSSVPSSGLSRNVGNKLPLLVA